MQIDETLMTAKVYYKKAGMDFFLVSIAMPDVGMFPGSIIVDSDRNGNLRVKPPEFKGHDSNGRPRVIKQIEFDKHKAMWKKIEQLALDAANTYTEPGEPP